MSLPVTEPPESRLSEPPGALEALARREAYEVAGRWPGCLTAWAELGESALREGRGVEAYAYFRVGYHRGLDRLRASGWRGAGRVPWSHAENRGWLRSLRGLGLAAGALGEDDEVARCSEFLSQVAPETPPS